MILKTFTQRVRVNGKWITVKMQATSYLQFERYIKVKYFGLKDDVLGGTKTGKRHKGV